MSPSRPAAAPLADLAFPQATAGTAHAHIPADLNNYSSKRGGGGRRGTSSAGATQAKGADEEAAEEEVANEGRAAGWGKSDGDGAVGGQW